jgi:acyl-coenzyme A synthetase/AMP-(fatty) acid ligase
MDLTKEEYERLIELQAVALGRAERSLATLREAHEELKKELQEHVKQVTAPYKYPRVIEFVDELPKTISGKIRRVEIRQNDAKPKD